MRVVHTMPSLPDSVSALFLVSDGGQATPCCRAAPQIFSRGPAVSVSFQGKLPDDRATRWKGSCDVLEKLACLAALRTFSRASLENVSCRGALPTYSLYIRRKRERAFSRATPPKCLLYVLRTSAYRAALPRAFGVASHTPCCPWLSSPWPSPHGRASRFPDTFLRGFDVLRNVPRP